MVASQEKKCRIKGALCVCMCVYVCIRVCLFVCVSVCGSVARKEVSNKRSVVYNLSVYVSVCVIASQEEAHRDRGDDRQVLGVVAAGGAAEWHQGSAAHESASTFEGTRKDVLQSPSYCRHTVTWDTLLFSKL